MDHTMRINSLPSITWNRMNINDVTVDWPESSALTPVFSGCEAVTERQVCNVPTGAGAAADVAFAALPAYVVQAKEGEHKETLMDLTAAEEKNGAAVLHLKAECHAKLTVYTRVQGMEHSHAALRLQLEAAEDAEIRLVELLEPGQQGRLLHDVGGNVATNAKVQVLHLYLGKGDIYSGCRMELLGEGADFTYEAGYLCQNRQVLDVNLIANHIGKNTTCNLRADGTLKDSAQKTFRGTIDFKRGCKGSVGAEQENVLLLGEDVVNKTIPLILCAEEDVQGDHGASIGELDEDTLFFFGSRGIDPLTAENILTREKLYRLAETMGREDMAQSARAAIEEVL